jgi:hypothetical protein
MQRRTLLALVVALMASVYPAQADAANDRHALTLTQGKRVITRFVSEVCAGVKGVLAERVRKCQRDQGGVLCLGSWITAEQDCSVWIGALPTRPAITVKKLGKITCAERSNEEPDIAPSANSSDGTARHE